ncbi:hypothetical protein MRB53_009489 [Persea americana]|uniref:Uncharacterized protein n=1 Tax=Persea americana TaxID=3435 RepID=A0ACC2LQ79_PERAE|nr:hypothetical protein MRB53_009489 [Persea americana]
MKAIPVSIGGCWLDSALWCGLVRPRLCCASSHRCNLSSFLFFYFYLFEHLLKDMRSKILPKVNHLIDNCDSTLFWFDTWPPSGRLWTVMVKVQFFIKAMVEILKPKPATIVTLFSGDSRGAICTEPQHPSSYFFPLSRSSAANSLFVIILGIIFNISPAAIISRVMDCFRSPFKGVIKDVEGRISYYKLYWINGLRS